MTGVVESNTDIDIHKKHESEVIELKKKFEGKCK